MEGARPSEHSTPASRVTVSYRATEGDDGGLTDSGWIRDRMQEDTYLTYLKRAHRGEVSVGDEWEEFVNCGCASPQDVIIRVESVDGGDELGMETDIEIHPRQAAAGEDNRPV